MNWNLEVIEFRCTASFADTCRDFVPFNSPEGRFVPAQGEIKWNPVKIKLTIQE